MAKTVQELEVWEWAINLDVAVSATIDAGNFQNHRRLREQISDATDSVLSNIAEGFDQPTDRAFVRYLYVSKSSNSEVRARLGSACRKSCISADQFKKCDDIADRVARMLTGLIKYLVRSDRKHRGIGRPDSEPTALPSKTPKRPKPTDREDSGPNHE
jgi:four helix bundle protein